MSQKNVRELVHEDAVLPPSRLGRIQDDQVPPTDLHGESRPLLMSRPEKMLQVACRDPGDIARIPNGHVVVICNCRRRESLERPTRQQATKLN
jgi:hypothetical protein